MAQRIAVIDLGSNTTRLVVYEYEAERCFRLTDEVREVVRLREGMGASLVLRAAAIDRSLRTLRMFSAFCNTLDIDEVILTATSAVRDARNRDSFLALVEAETGWRPRLLSGEEEGYYGALGAVNASGLRAGFVIDLGGGSAQVVEVRQGAPARRLSLPLGALRLSEMFLGFDRAKPADVEALRAFLQEQLASLDWFQAGDGDELVAIGGTVRNLAKVDQVARHYPLDSVHGYRLSAERLNEMANRMWRLTAKQRGRLSGLNEDRADIIQSGALAYSALLAHSGFSHVTVSHAGLREGVFFEHFLADRPEPILTDLRRFSVLNLACNFGCDNVHSRHVTALSLRLFDELASVHGLDQGYRELLWAAGVLHDIGAHIDYHYHHHHSAYVILNSGLPGYSPREMALIALLARYHRKGNPKPGSLASLLSQEDRGALVSLAAMLRLSEFLERGRTQVIRDLRCHLDVAGGWLQIEALAAGDASVELWDASRNAGLLSKALNLDVELVGGVWLAERAAARGNAADGSP